MKTWTLKLTVSVADSWVADGFDMKERLEDVQDQITSMLPFAYSHELIVNAKIIKAPSEKEVYGLQSGDVEISD